uniref:sugar phosphate isomerase/epimerase n=1 Tax=Pedobacter schmidteae TaxID=2201271 RepID=UPI000EB3F562|nr:sugar phosphate isomerase/epimerase [Pedobacter schmidteae]
MGASLKFLCPRWGFEDIPWDVFLKQVKDAGYAGVEWFPFGETVDAYSVLDLLNSHELDFAIVMAVTKPYTNYEQYMTHLKTDLYKLMEIRNEFKTPLFFSAQTGREFFNDAQIESCLTLCREFEDAYQTPVYQETHRNKWSYAAHRVAPVLEQYPDLKLTLDMSHWFCVSESFLTDQQAAVNTAILHARHIHARVGNTQSPQVWDPAHSEYAEALEAHVRVWDRWVTQMKKNKMPITITPEFGPAPYMVKGDRTLSLRDEQWRINLWMKDFLQKRYC